MPNNIETLLQFIDQEDDYLEGLDLMISDTPFGSVDEDEIFEDADLTDLEGL